MLESAWMWAILGLVLLGAEMLTGTFYILWFGIASLSVALLLFIWPSTPLSLQLLAFSALSLASLALWRIKYGKPAPTSHVGQSRGDAIGQIGQVREAVSPQQLGRIVFTLPVMGSRDWVIISEDTIAEGSGAEIVGIEGNYLKVRAIK